MKPGLPELLIILLVVVLLFGPGRIGKIAGEFGNGIRSFRDGLKSKNEEKENTSEENSGEETK